MINKFKFMIGAVFVTAVLAIVSPYTNMVGKQYNKNMDFSCCKNNQLIIHHYYQTKLFFAIINYGYDLEPVGKPSAACNISCE